MLFLPNLSCSPQENGEEQLRFAMNVTFNKTSANSFSKATLPNNDRKGFVQEEPLVLPLYPIISAFHWVIIVSTLLGNISPVDPAIQ